MTGQSFTTQFEVTADRAEVFDAVTRVGDWWSETITGSAQRLGDEFVFSDRGIRKARFRLVEADRPSRLRWDIVESDLLDIDDHEEWTGTSAEFDITEGDGLTTVRFSHQGLLPTLACYQACSRGWSHYAGVSLKKLIETGTGDPIRISDV